VVVAQARMEEPQRGFWNKPFSQRLAHGRPAPIPRPHERGRPFAGSRDQPWISGWLVFE
jgi:hypothetical protein